MKLFLFVICTCHHVDLKLFPLFFVLSEVLLLILTVYSYSGTVLPIAHADLNLPELLCIMSTCEPFPASTADKYPGTVVTGAMQIHRWRNWKTSLTPYNLLMVDSLRGGEALSSGKKGKKAVEANLYKEITVSPAIWSQEPQKLCICPFLSCNIVLGIFFLIFSDNVLCHFSFTLYAPLVS